MATYSGGGHLELDSDDKEDFEWRRFQASLDGEDDGEDRLQPCGSLSAWFQPVTSPSR